MSEIILRKANVVKRVDSDDRAKALEAKGFVRTDGKTVPAATAEELRAHFAEAQESIKAAEARGSVLEKKLSDAKGQLAEAEDRIRALETELSGTREQLAEAEDRIRTLETELSGTREQLEAAVEKNQATAKKGK